jgi:hypothetical protein
MSAAQDIQHGSSSIEMLCLSHACSRPALLPPKTTRSPCDAGGHGALAGPQQDAHSEDGSNSRADSTSARAPNHQAERHSHASVLAHTSGRGTPVGLGQTAWSKPGETVSSSEAGPDTAREASRLNTGHWDTEATPDRQAHCRRIHTLPLLCSHRDRQQQASQALGVRADCRQAVQRRRAVTR